jgi:hypothetical protein
VGVEHLDGALLIALLHRIKDLLVLGVGRAAASRVSEVVLPSPLGHHVCQRSSVLGETIRSWRSGQAADCSTR